MTKTRVPLFFQIPLTSFARRNLLYMPFGLRSSRLHPCLDRKRSAHLHTTHTRSMLSSKAISPDHSHGSDAVGQMMAKYDTDKS